VKRLVAAFEPFGGRKRNRALDAARRMSDVQLATLPVEFAALPNKIAELLSKRPRLLLLVGESAQAHALKVERFALNLAHARIPDNAGAQPIDEPLEPGGELARQVRFDPRIAVEAALAVGVACESSAHAGTFCCNAAFYHALGQAAYLPETPLVAFVHVPARWPWAPLLGDDRPARGLDAISGALGQLID
jgi:pyroglutamyl-peptidase